MLRSLPRMLRRRSNARPLCDSQEASQGYNAANPIDGPKSKDSFQLMQEGELVNVFPFQLNPPIVLVERKLLYDGVLVEVDSEKDLKIEEQIEKSVAEFGGAVKAKSKINMNVKVNEEFAKQRKEPQMEERIEQSVTTFGGVFAGT
jgi:hypothetical protein